MVIVIEYFNFDYIVHVDADLLVMDMKIQMSFQTSLVKLSSVELLEECWAITLLCS